MAGAHYTGIGVQPMHINVQVRNSAHLSSGILSTTRMPGFLPRWSDPMLDILQEPDLMRHLFGLFEKRFGRQYPFLDRAVIEQQLLEMDTGNVFLLNCIAAMAARLVRPSCGCQSDLVMTDFHRTHPSYRSTSNEANGEDSTTKRQGICLAASCPSHCEKRSWAWSSSRLTLSLQVTLVRSKNSCEADGR